MKKVVLFLSLSLLAILWFLVSCDTATTPLVTSERTEATAEPSEEVTSEENTAEAATTEEEATKCETIEEATTEDEPYIEKLELAFHRPINADFFDYQRTYIPDDEDFEKLQQGMTIAEVIEIIGRPHGRTNDNTPRLYWFSTGNYAYFLFRDHPKDENGNRLTPHCIFEEYALSTLYKFEKHKQKNDVTEPPVLEGSYSLVEDPHYKTLPSYKDLIKISVGTTFQEIVELYGKPQCIDLYKGTNASKQQYVFYVFYTAEGINVGVQFLSTQTGNDLDLSQWYAVSVLNLGTQDHYCLEYKFPEVTTATP